LTQSHQAIKATTDIRMTTSTEQHENRSERTYFHIQHETIQHESRTYSIQSHDHVSEEGDADSTSHDATLRAASKDDR